MESQPRIHQALNRVAHAEFADFRDAQNLRRRKAVQVNLRITRFAASAADFRNSQSAGRDAVRPAAGCRCRRAPASRRSSCKSLEREDVAVLRAQRAVERAERAILRAEIRVVDVAIDLVGNDARIVFLQSQLMRGHTDPNEIVGLQHVQRFLFRDRHVQSSLRLRLSPLLPPINDLPCLRNDPNLRGQVVIASQALASSPSPECNRYFREITPQFFGWQIQLGSGLVR